VGESRLGKKDVKEMVLRDFKSREISTFKVEPIVKDRLPGPSCTGKGRLHGMDIKEKAGFPLLNRGLGRFSTSDINWGEKHAPRITALTKRRKLEEG